VVERRFGEIRQFEFVELDIGAAMIYRPGNSRSNGCPPVPIETGKLSS
jgi:hypothetical protein